MEHFLFLLRTLSFPWVYPCSLRYTSSVLHFLVHEKALLPQVCPCMTVWNAEDSAPEDRGQGRTWSWIRSELCGWVCNNSAGPWRPCRAWWAMLHPSPYTLSPSVSISVRPSSSFFLCNMSHSPHNTEHPLTQYVMTALFTFCTTCPHALRRRLPKDGSCSQLCSLRFSKHPECGTAHRMGSESLWWINEWWPCG